MGDLNCARGPMDIYNPKKIKDAGYTPQERASFEERILGQEAAASAAGLRDVWARALPGAPRVHVLELPRQVLRDKQRVEARLRAGALGARRG